MVRGDYKPTKTDGCKKIQQKNKEGRYQRERMHNRTTKNTAQIENMNNTNP
jgi:hypothetical protein